MGFVWFSLGLQGCTGFQRFGGARFQSVLEDRLLALIQCSGSRISLNPKTLNP